jgi:hypothetical protein
MPIPAKLGSILTGTEKTALLSAINHFTIYSFLKESIAKTALTHFNLKHDPPSN